MKYILLILMVIVMASCFNKGDCLKTNSDIVWLSFRKKENGKQDTIFVNSLTAQGFPNVFIAGKSVNATIGVQINPNQPYTNFIFNYTKGKITKTDTLKLTYRPLARLPATDCGAFLYFTDLNFIKTGFDSVRIVNSQLLKDATINAQIFL